MTATFAAAGSLGGGTDLTMVGGSEVMSRPSLALTADASKPLTDLFAQDAMAALQSLTPRDYVLPDFRVPISDFRASAKALPIPSSFLPRALCADRS